MQPRPRNPRQAAITAAGAPEKLPKGEAKFEVESSLVDKIGGATDVTLKVNGKTVAQRRAPRAMSPHLPSDATFDSGTDLDCPVTPDY